MRRRITSAVLALLLGFTLFDCPGPFGTITNVPRVSAMPADHREVGQRYTLTYPTWSARNGLGMIVSNGWLTRSDTRSARSDYVRAAQAAVGRGWRAWRTVDCGRTTCIVDFQNINEPLLVTSVHVTRKHLRFTNPFH